MTHIVVLMRPDGSFGVHAACPALPRPAHTQANQYGVPIYITETGIADRSDANRAYMIDTYLRAVRAPPPGVGGGGCGASACSQAQGCRAVGQPAGPVAACASAPGSGSNL